MEEQNNNVKFQGAVENRSRIYCRLVNPELIGDKLDSLPHERYLDMAAVYYMRITISKDSYLTMLVNRDHLQSWKIDEGEIAQIAWENTLRDYPSVFKKLHEMIRELGAEIPEEVEGLYVLSNERRELGALTLFYPGQLKTIADKLNSEFYVIPSSVHECLIIKYDEKIEASFLRKMLMSVNREEVAEKDVLSNNIYRYIRSQDRLIIDNS